MKQFRITYEWTDTFQRWEDPTTFIFRVTLYAKDREDAKKRLTEYRDDITIKRIIELH